MRYIPSPYPPWIVGIAVLVVAALAVWVGSAWADEVTYVKPCYWEYKHLSLCTKCLDRSPAICLKYEVLDEMINAALKKHPGWEVYKFDPRPSTNEYSESIAETWLRRRWCR